MQRKLCETCAKIFHTEKHWANNCLVCWKISTGTTRDALPYTMKQISLLQEELERSLKEQARMTREVRRLRSECYDALGAVDTLSKQRDALLKRETSVDRSAVRRLLRIVHPDRAAAMARMDESALSSQLGEATKIVTSF
jgi:hypothetical protein